MKDLRIVLAIAIPLVLVAGGLYFAQNLFAPEDVSVVPVGDSGAGTGKRPDPGPEVPREEWPKEPGAGVGPSSPFPEFGNRTPVDGEPMPALSVELLRRLLEAGDPKALRRIEELLRAGNIEEPFLVAQVLMEYIDKGGNNGIWISKFLPLLRDERVRERIAVDLLGKLDSYKDRNGITAALLVIGKVGGPENVPDLGKIARTHPLRDAVARALYAMADIGGEEAAGELAAYLRESIGNTDLEPLAFRAIENLKSPEMVKALDGLIKDKDPKVQIAGVEALGQAAGTKAASDMLLDLWKKGGSLGRQAGLQLGKATGKAATDGFIAEIDKVGDDVTAKVGMVTALGTNGGEPARAKCYDLLRNPDEKESVRGAAAFSLAEMGDKRGMGMIVEIVGSPRAEARLLDAKVLQSVPRLAHRNKEAGKELREKVLPLLKKRIEESPHGANSNWIVKAIQSLELTRHQ